MLKLLIWSSLVAVVWSACDVCDKRNSVACRSERIFSLCINDVPSQDYMFCPEGFVCTNEPQICVPKSRADPSCPIVNEDNESRCGICNLPDRVFSCIDEKTVAFCYGLNTPNLNTTIRCPEGTICHLENEKYFCSNQNLYEPSCREELNTSTTIEESEPTPTTPRDPNTFCRDMEKTGSYKPDGDTQCKRFIICYELNGIFYGAYRSCDGDSYFNESFGLCALEKPPHCD